MCLDVQVDSAQAVVGLLRDKQSAAEPSTLSERSLADSQAEMGYGTTRPLERVMASCGLLTSAELEFVAADDVTGRFRLEELGANLPRQLALKFRIEEGSVRIYVTSLRPDSNARFDRAVLAGLIHPCPICHGKGIHNLKRTAHLERYSIYVAGDKYGKCARYVKEALRRAVGFWQRCGGRFSRPVIGTEFLAFVFPDVF